MGYDFVWLECGNVVKKIELGVEVFKVLIIRFVIIQYNINNYSEKLGFVFIYLLWWFFYLVWFSLILELGKFRVNMKK